MDEIRKFPVFAKSGTEYLVEIKNNGYYGGHYSVSLLVPYIGELFKKRTKWMVVSNYSYNGTDFKFNFIEMAKNLVENYETHLEQTKKHKELLIERQKEFETWNGK